MYEKQSFTLNTILNNKPYNNKIFFEACKRQGANSLEIKAR